MGAQKPPPGMGLPSVPTRQYSHPILAAHSVLRRAERIAVQSVGPGAGTSGPEERASGGRVETADWGRRAESHSEREATGTRLERTLECWQSGGASGRRARAFHEAAAEAFGIDKTTASC